MANVPVANSILNEVTFEAKVKLWTYCTQSALAETVAVEATVPVCNTTVSAVPVPVLILIITSTSDL